MDNGGHESENKRGSDPDLFLQILPNLIIQLKFVFNLFNLFLVKLA